MVLDNVVFWGILHASRRKVKRFAQGGRRQEDAGVRDGGGQVESRTTNWG
ncbi:hypothetical protein EDC38_2553 [Marinimicrobium koreense]|uniref:Uncharacterized protein n=1 Tax=Marinimicrobium koreense TaxID=306545 RepID=A0A3N1NSD2_9GAMM|nr:hypothetical protein EDC38_2553 [Marinimicrobium koreense]